MRMDMGIKEKTKRQIEESYNHMEPFLDNLKVTEELRKMCEYCEGYCGEEHNYEECKDLPCFNFYLCFEYMEWRNSFEGE